SLGIDPEDLDLTVAEVLLGKAPAVDALVTTEESLDLLPASIQLAAAEENLVTRTGREQRLKVALATIADDYDWTLLDCPPPPGSAGTSRPPAAGSRRAPSRRPMR